MSVFVTYGFLVEALAQFFRKVDACLVGKTDQDPQYVGHLLANVGLLAFLETLVAIGACHHTGQFAYLFGQAGHVGKFAEIAYAVVFYPFVYSFLGFSECHCFLFI